MAVISHQEALDAGLALLRALGVKDTDQIVSFTLHFHCQEWPRLTIVRYPTDDALDDKTTLASAAALVPCLQVEEQVAES